MRNDTKVIAHRNYLSNQVELSIASLQSDRLYWMDTPAFSLMEDGCMVPPAQMSISMQAAQDLFDQLYQIGFRPAAAAAVDTALAAKDAHIADLQRVAFGLLEVAIKDRQNGDD